MKVMSGAGCADADGAQPSSGLKSPEWHVNMSESGDTSGFSTTHLKNRGGGADPVQSCQWGGGSEEDQWE